MEDCEWSSGAVASWRGMGRPGKALPTETSPARLAALPKRCVTTCSPPLPLEVLTINALLLTNRRPASRHTFRDKRKPAYGYPFPPARRRPRYQTANFRDQGHSSMRPPKPRVLAPGRLKARGPVCPPTPARAPQARRISHRYSIHTSQAPFLCVCLLFAPLGTVLSEARYPPSAVVAV